MQEGTLRLLEIETPHEYADNIALVWVPAQTPVPGEVFNYSYDLYFGERSESAIAMVRWRRLHLAEYPQKPFQ